MLWRLNHARILFRWRETVKHSKISLSRHRLRPFTQNARFQLISPSLYRPQLPFLHPPTCRNALQHQNKLQLRFGRFLTTETKKYLRYQAIVTIQVTIALGLGLILCLSIYHGAVYLVIDDRHPSPAEWSLWTRLYWLAFWRQQEVLDPRGIVNWTATFSLCMKVLDRLEDPSVDGASIKAILPSEVDASVQGSGETRLNVSEKSEEWRQGYFQCLMLAAQASEKLVGMVWDVKRRIIFPADAIVGPANPRPRQLGKGAPDPPQEGDTEPLQSPAELYMKVLTTQGFTSRQRLEAAIAYADWLDFTGLNTAAEEVLDWGLDIAMGSLPITAVKSIDIQTGIISSQADHVSSNMLTASSALASHHAKLGVFSSAMALYLSVLRAQRSLAGPGEGKKASEAQAHDAISHATKHILYGAPMTPSSPTGDELPERTESAVCDEASTMLSIGEILFATGRKTREDGLSWTKQAIDLVEATLDACRKDDMEANSKCGQCLRLGLDNWDSMVATLLKDDKVAKAANSQPKKSNSWAFWRAKPDEDETDWSKELDTLTRRRHGLRQMIYEAEKRGNQKSFFAQMLGV